MDGESAGDATVKVNVHYPHAQLAKAFTTALTHEDEATRRRAEERFERWHLVLQGMADGTLTIGSREPVSGLPAWVTPKVVRGGFATGQAAAEGPLEPYETEAARRAGIAAERRALFNYYLTDAGLAELCAYLDEGRYDVALPEEGALLVVAWLLRAGDSAAAVAVLEAIEPFADRLRFAPRPRPAGPPGSGAGAEVVHRASVGDVRQALGRRAPNPAVAAMNEALAVWNPFADELLAHWLETADPETGRVASRVPDDGWRARGEALLVRYRALKAEHTLCRKHRRPRENLAILRSALEQVVEGRGAPERPGLLQHAVDAMVRRRGAPGTAVHAALREQQAGIAARPTHHALAQVLVGRLAELPADGGLADPDRLTGPVTADEARRSRGLVAGAAVPPSLRAAVETATAAPIGTLVERGVVPSAEVMAQLVPQLVAWTTAQSYVDEPLRVLMAGVYRAFRNRRSLLLLNLEHQVQLTELPWVRAVHGHRSPGGGFADGARTALVRLGELALQGFPGTVLPNPLLKELGALARAAGIDVPLVEELAADIFMGAFSGKFLRAAQLAGELLEGSLYARYYGIDYGAIQGVQDTTWVRGFSANTSASFADLCVARAGARGLGDSPAVNGMVIEQAQILTTHNLAALVHPIGVDPSPGWDDLARRAFVTACRLTGRLHNNPRPLGTVKDAAYAWRQAVFFLALCGLEEQIAVVAWMREETARHPAHVGARLAPALSGLRHVLTGGTLDGDAPPGARRFLGWKGGRRHWILTPA
ncbi:transcriptional regulator [Actinomadura rugatobispora]|uniref:Transcriptional regulator n=1 Tax=Actinomadura rugatobispora TaxID=1994 RepID=A0ABW0ZTL9_9ACTN|nr:hypothetical protein GCM10010200_027210 [Actinomadura rugatobispora]